MSLQEETGILGHAVEISGWMFSGTELRSQEKKNINYKHYAISQQPPHAIFKSGKTYAVRI
jgi:hypothetical protein